MRAFVDSSALIAFHRKEDQHFEQAGRIFGALREKNASLYLSNHILEEVVTFLAARQGAEAAYKLGVRLLQSPQVTVLFSTEKKRFGGAGRAQETRRLELVRCIDRRIDEGTWDRTARVV